MTDAERDAYTDAMHVLYTSKTPEQLEQAYADFLRLGGTSMTKVYNGQTAWQFKQSRIATFSFD